MFNTIKADFTRYSNTGKNRLPFFKLLHKLISAYGLFALMVYRFGRFIDTSMLKPYLLPVKLFSIFCYLIMNSIIKALFGISINKHAEIGRGVKIGHFGGIEIGLCRIGEYCNIHHQVRIGKNDPSFQSKGPRIGNQVWIGAHAIIDEDITVEDHATIAAGSVVKSDVKSGCIVVGDPARVIRKSYDNTFLLGLPDDIKSKRKQAS